MVHGNSNRTRKEAEKQEKYVAAAALLAEMEKKAVMAQTMLEATMQYSLAKTKGKPSLRFSNQDSSAIRTRQELTQEIPARDISLLCTPFGLDWGDRNKNVVSLTNLRCSEVMTRFIKIKRLCATDGHECELKMFLCVIQVVEIRSRLQKFWSFSLIGIQVLVPGASSAAAKSLRRNCYHGFSGKGAAGIGLLNGSEQRDSNEGRPNEERVKLVKGYDSMRNSLGCWVQGLTKRTQPSAVFTLDGSLY
ncbi:hypothetical protein Tco_1209968 [Tanacetum coccineum]